MIAKILYRKIPVYVRTPHNNPDGEITPEYIGPAPLVKMTKRKISTMSGFYGHTLDPERISNLDLAHVLVVGKDWVVDEIVPEIKPNPLPPNVTT